jgi:hypothetical protein
MPLFFSSFLLSLVFSDDGACPPNVSDERFFRCLLKGNLSLSLDVAFGSTAVYVHNSRTANLTVTVQNRPFCVHPGRGLQVLLTNQTSPALVKTVLSCSDCFLTIWHSTYGYNHANFISDAAGAIFKSKPDGNEIPERYPVFFDFGNQTRLRVEHLEHRREQPLALYRWNDGSTWIEMFTNYSQDGDDFNGPGIFQISSSPYLLSIFRIIVGSTTAIPDTFSNQPAHGRFAEVAMVDGNLSYTEGWDGAAFAYPAIEHMGWRTFAMVMIGVTGLVGVLSIGGLVYGIIRHFHGAKGAAEPKQAEPASAATAG